MAFNTTFSDDIKTGLHQRQLELQALEQEQSTIQRRMQALRRSMTEAQVAQLSSSASSARRNRKRDDVESMEQELAVEDNDLAKVQEKLEAVKNAIKLLMTGDT